MRRSAAVALIVGAAAAAAVAGGLAPFAGSLIGDAATAAGSVLGGPSSSPPASAPATAAAKAAHVAKVKPTVSVPAAAQLALPRRACDLMGGQLVVLSPTDLQCSEIPYIGADGSTYYGSAGVTYGGAGTGPVSTYHPAATQQECGTSTPDTWSQLVALCQPEGAAPPLWLCTIMETDGTPSGPLEIRASFTSGYASQVTVNFTDGLGRVFPPVTYPVNETGPFTLREPVPPGDIGASAEPSTCTAS